MLCKDGIDKPLAAVRYVLSRLDLTLNETKAYVVDAREESFVFLGFEISVNRSWRTGSRYTNTCPSKKSLAKIKIKLKQKTARKLTPVPLEHIVSGMNASLRGWSNYFHYSKKLYEKYGLYKVPTTAGWKSAHASGEKHRKAVCGKTACTV